MNMKFVISTLFLAILIISNSGCQKENADRKLLESGKYSGTFNSNEDIIMPNDSVFLSIADGHYYCATNIPFNYGAGTVEFTESTINFADTLFFPIPALYITGFALSGEYGYEYDGSTLILESLYDNNNLTYTLKRTE